MSTLWENPIHSQAYNLLSIPRYQSYQNLRWSRYDLLFHKLFKSVQAFIGQNFTEQDFVGNIFIGQDFASQYIIDQDFLANSSFSRTSLAKTLLAWNFLTRTSLAKTLLARTSSTSNLYCPFGHHTMHTSLVHLYPGSYPWLKNPPLVAKKMFKYNFKKQIGRMEGS